MKGIQIRPSANIARQSEKQFGTEDQIPGEWDGSQEILRPLDSKPWSLTL